jgi:hypothetical protein
LLTATAAAQCPGNVDEAALTRVDDRLPATVNKHFPGTMEELNAEQAELTCMRTWALKQPACVKDAYLHRIDFYQKDLNEASEEHRTNAARKENDARWEAARIARIPEPPISASAELLSELIRNFRLSAERGDLNQTSFCNGGDDEGSRERSQFVLSGRECKASQIGARVPLPSGTLPAFNPNNDRGISSRVSNE